MNVKKISTKALSLLLVLMFVIMLLPVSGMAANSYTGTAVSELTDGDYLIVGRYSSSYDYYALSNATAGSSGGGYGFTGVKVDSFDGTTAAVTDDTKGAIWTYSASAKSFYNAASGKYLNLPSSAYSESGFFSSSAVALSYYNISGTEGTVYVPNGNGGYYLGAAYPSNGKVFSSKSSRYMNSAYLSAGDGVYFCKLSGSASLKDTEITLSDTSVSLDEGASAVVTVEAEGCTVSVSSSNKEVATASVKDGEITIQAVSEGSAVITVSGEGDEGYNDPDSQTISVSVTAPEYPDHEKSIKGSEEDYTISLNVTARDKAVTTSSTTPGQTVEKGTNLVMVIDVSGSIVGKEEALNSAIQSLVSGLPDSSQVGIVTFNESAATSKVYTKSSISGLEFSGVEDAGTKMATGIQAAASLLNGSSWSDTTNRKAMVIISDFDVDDYADSINAAKTAKDADTTIYSVKIDVKTVGAASTTELTTDDRDASVPAVTRYISSEYPEASAVNNSMFGLFNQATVTTGSKDSENTYVYGAGGGNWSEIFAEIQETQGITVETTEYVPMSNVVIADTLSEYVKLQNTSASDNYGVTVTPAAADFTVSVNGKTVSVTLSGELTKGTVYTVNIPVEPTDEAQAAANKGEDDTSDLPTNDGATLSYQYGSDPTVTVEYEEEPVITLEKEFYLHHSSDDSIETIKWSELKDGTMDVTERVKDSCFYGGLFTDADYENPSTVPGTQLQPEGGATYYMREVSDAYLNIRMEYIYRGEKIDANTQSTYAMTNVDSDVFYQEVGLEYSDPDKKDLRTDTVYKTLKVITSTNTFIVTVPEAFGSEGDGYIAVDTVNLKNEGTNGTVTSYWITLDGVKVPGYTRTLEGGLKSNTVNDVRSSDEVSTTDPSEDGLTTEEQCVIDETAPQEETIVNLAGYTTSLNGKIEMNFYMELSDDVAADETAYMQFVLPGSNHTSEKVMLSEARKSVRGGKTYYVFPAGVAAKDMTSDITAKFIWSGGESESWTYSIKDYCDYVIDHADSYDAESVELVESMLNYGGYAQVYFKYNTTDLANADLDKELPEVSLDDSYAPVTSGECTGLTWKGSSAMLTTTTGIRHYFEITGDISDYTFTVEGTELTPELDSKTGYYYVLIDDIHAKDLDKAFALTVSHTDGTSYTVKYSVYSNVKLVLEDPDSTEEACNLMKAVYAYGIAAEEYFKTR